MSDTTPYSVPKEPGRWRAISLAALVHAALLALLWFGIRWQSETPVAVEAEVWSPQPREAAPRPQPPPPKEEEKPEPKPIVKEIPKIVKETPPPVPVTPPIPKPDIVLEQEKKRKAAAEKKHIEEERMERLRRLAEERRIQQEKAARAKRLEEEREREAALAKQKHDTEKQKNAEQQREAEKLKRAAEEKKRKDEALAKKAADEKRRKQETANAQVLAKGHDDEIQRVNRTVIGTGGSGDAPKAQGGGRADAAYAQRVGAKIKSNIFFNLPEDLTGNPPVEYVVELLPDGSVAGMRKIKSSGVPGFDEAVERAIKKSQPYPKDKSGSVPSSFTGIHRPKDQ